MQITVICLTWAACVRENVGLKPCNDRLAVCSSKVASQASSSASFRLFYAHVSPKA